MGQTGDVGGGHGSDVAVGGLVEDVNQQLDADGRALGLLLVRNDARQHHHLQQHAALLIITFTSIMIVYRSPTAQVALTASGAGQIPAYTTVNQHVTMQTTLNIRQKARTTRTNTKQFTVLNRKLGVRGEAEWEAIYRVSKTAGFQ